MQFLFFALSASSMLTVIGAPFCAGPGALAEAKSSQKTQKHKAKTDSEDDETEEPQKSATSKKSTTAEELKPDGQLRQWVDHERAADAIKPLTAFLKQHPNNKYALFWRGIGYTTLKQYRAAIADYTAYLAIMPNDFRVWQRLGRDYVLINDNENAVRCLSKSLQICPNDPWANRDRSTAYQRLGRKEASEMDHSRYLDTKARFGNRKVAAKLEKEGKYQEALAKYKNALGNDFDEESQLLRRAKLLVKMADYDAAAAQCDEISKKFPKYSKAYSCKAAVEVQLGDPDKALKSADQALAINPLDEDALLVKARAEAAVGKLTNAIKDYTAYIKLKDDSWDAYMERGDVHAKLHDDKAAIADYTTVGDHNPADKSVMLRRSKLNLQLKNYDAAIKDLIAFQKSSQPNDDQPFVELAQAYSAAGKYQLAVDTFSKAINLDKEPSTLDGRATAYEKLGRSEQAAADRTAAAKLRALAEHSKNTRAH